MKCKLVKVSRIEFQQTPWKALRKVHLFSYVNQVLLCINMDEDWILHQQ
jgi:hypothetical protein